MIVPQNCSGAEDPLPRIFSIVWERKRIAIVCILTCFVAAATGYYRATPSYKSEAILALDVRKLQVLPTESVVSPLPQESPVLRTELDIISSRSMAEQVLRTLNAPVDPSVAGPKLGRLTTDSDDRRSAVLISSNMVDELMQNVRVMNDGHSYTIYISYFADDPQYAARVANAFGQAYIDYQINLQTSATRRVSDWLGERLVNLRTKLEESERQASDFRERAGLVAAGGMTLQSQETSGLNAELIGLRAKLAGLKARLSTALQIRNSDDYLGIAEVLASPSIQSLKAEEARINRLIAEINQSGAKMNPQLPQLSSQLISLRQQIYAEINQITDSIRNEITVNEQQQDGISSSIAELQATMSKTNQAIVHSSQLDREASADRAIYESYLGRYKQTIEQDGIASAEARIISRAMPSKHPTSPNAGLWALGAFVFGSAFGFALILVAHLTDKSIRSSAALEARVGVPVIGQIPRIYKDPDVQENPLLTGRPDFNRSIADLQASLLINCSKSRVIAFTSNVDQEGKTFVLSNLARSLAATGVRTVILDGNLRNPKVSNEFAPHNMNHLAQFMNNEISTDELLQHDVDSTVQFIVAKRAMAPPEYILGNHRFSGLISELKGRFDLVLIDAPSADDGLDLMRIACLSDTVAIVISKDVTNVDAVSLIVKRLHTAGRHISGIVMNGAPKPKRAGGLVPNDSQVASKTIPKTGASGIGNPELIVSGETCHRSQTAFAGR